MKIRLSSIIRTRPSGWGQVVVWGGESKEDAMIEDAINDGKTVAGGKDVTLAGCYHIIRQLGQG